MSYYRCLFVFVRNKEVKTKVMDKKVEKICSNFLNYYFKSKRSKSELYYDCQPFMNFLDVVWKDVCSFDYPDLEITELIIEKCILELEGMPSDISSFYSSLINSIKTSFERNKGEHFIIIPLYGSKLNQSVSFCNNSFYLIPTGKNEESLYRNLADVMNIDDNKCFDMFEHTKRSRSKNFFNHNLLLIRIENQTSHVNLNAITIAIRAIYLIHLLHWALNTPEDVRFSLRKKTADLIEENQYVLLMSNEEWRCSHRFIPSGLPKCKIDLDFFKEEKYQNIFSDLFTEFIMNQGDNLSQRFVNSLVLLNRGFQFEVKHDNDLATLLYTTSAEALLTAEKNEKRLRFAATLSKVISIDGIKRTELAKILDNVYRKRNDFVHAGVSPFYKYCKNENSDLEITRIAISKLIIKYNEINKSLVIDGEGDRSKKWNTYIDQLFINLIFGER